MSAVRHLAPAFFAGAILVAASSGWTQEATGYGQLRAGGTGACLAVDGLSPSSRVLLLTCGEPTMQAWRYEPAPGRVRFGATDLCLHGRGPARPGEGGPVRLGPCDDDGAKGWTGTMANNRLTLKHAGLGLCLDPVGKNTTKAGTVVRLAACGDADQSFAVTRVTPSVSLHDAAGFTGGAKAVSGQLDVASGWAGHSVASLRLLDTTAAIFDGPNFTGRCRTLTASESLLTAPVASVKAGTTCAALGVVDAPPPPETFPVFDAALPPSVSPRSAPLRLRALGLCLVGDASGGVKLGDCGASDAEWTRLTTGDLGTTAGPRCLDEAPTGLVAATCRREDPEVFDLVVQDDLPAFAKIVQRSSGLCVAATGAVAKGGPVTLADCDLGDRALWTWGDAAATADAANASQPDALMQAAETQVWPGGVVPVCWENPEAADTGTRERIQHAIEDEWGGAAALTFTGWGKCPFPPVGEPEVRILLTDTPTFNQPKSVIGPHAPFATASSFGARSNDNPGLLVNDGRTAPTMVLNTDFRNFHESCRGNDDSDCWFYGTCASDRTARCQEYAAVHEFGHALGFRHEQSRDDTPSDCAARETARDQDAGDVKLTAYDEDSVMNYCRGYKINGESFLSIKDIQGVSALYGPPSPRAFLWEHAGYQGAKERVEGVALQLATLSDKVSSISLLNTDVIAVYEDSYLGGVCETITRDLASFSNTLIGGDEVSSVIVGRTCDGGSSDGQRVAQLFLDSGYQLTGGVVQVWATELPRLSARGANDAISSIDLGEGVRVASLYQDADYQGTCVTINSDMPSLDLPGLGHDSISSIKFNVTCDGLADVPTAGLQLWDDASFAGQPVVLPRDIPDLDARGFHDKASSAKLFGGVTVAALWENDNYTGRCYTVTGDVAQLSTTLFGNDSADSVWVGRGCDGQTTPPVNGIRLFQDAGASGPSVLLTTDTPSLAAVGMSDSASSARMEGTVALAAVYQDADYGGLCETVSGAVDFGALRIGNDSASSVRVGVDCFGNRLIVTIGARLYADANFVGAALFAPGNIASLGGVGFGDTLSSIRLEGGLRAAAIYEDANYTGRCQSIYANTASLTGLVVQGDSASSIKVGVDCNGSPVPPQGGVRVFWDSNYGGESLWVTGSLASVGNHWNDEITSIRFEGTGVSVVALYEDSNYRGDCTTVWGTVAANGTVSGGLASLSGSTVGNDEVTSILVGSPCR